MTQPTPPVDLAAILDRYDLANDTIPGKAGETMLEWRERMDMLLADRAWDCVEDIPTLVAEVRRLQALLETFSTDAVPEVGTPRGPGGLIDVTDHRSGPQQWILTCDEHGELGRWPVVPYVDKTEPELAWDRHVAEGCGAMEPPALDLAAVKAEIERFRETPHPVAWQADLRYDPERDRYLDADGVEPPEQRRRRQLAEEAGWDEP